MLNELRMKNPGLRLYSVLDPECQRIPMIHRTNHIRILLRAGPHQIAVDIKESRDQRVAFPMPSATQASKELGIRHAPCINGPVVELRRIAPNLLQVAIGQYGRSAGFFTEESVAIIATYLRRSEKAVQNIQVRVGCGPTYKAAAFIELFA